MKSRRRERPEKDRKDERPRPLPDEEVAAGSPDEDREHEVDGDVLEQLDRDEGPRLAGQPGERLEPLDHEKDDQRAAEEVVPRLKVDVHRGPSCGPKPANPVLVRTGSARAT